MAEAPVDLLKRWVTRQAGDAAGWYAEAVVAMAAERDLHIVLGLAPRRLGKADLDLSDADLADADAAYPGWNPSGWSVDAKFGQDRVHTQIDVLTWSDLVQDSMSAGIAATYGMLAQTVWTYVRSGTLRRLMWMRKGPVIAADALGPDAAFLEAVANADKSED